MPPTFDADLPKQTKVPRRTYQGNGVSAVTSAVITRDDTSSTNASAGKRGDDIPQRLPQDVPIIGLGCSSFSSFFSRDGSGVGNNGFLTLNNISKDHPQVRSWIETVRHAICNRGINLLDTAPWYGHGMSEIVLGYALDEILLDDHQADDGDAQTLLAELALTRKRSGTVPRTDIILNTKVGRYEADARKQFDFSTATTLASVKRSIERMNCSYIDVLQLHDPEFAPSMDVLLNETIPTLLQCRDKFKLTRAIGLTGYPLEVQYEILVKSRGLADVNGYGVVFDQSLVYCHSNLHDMSLFYDRSFRREKRLGLTSDLHSSNRAARSSSGQVSVRAEKSSEYVSFADFCVESSTHFIAAAPLSMGLLTEAGPPEWHPALPALKDASALAARMCIDAGVNVSSLSILFALSRTRISCTLIGMRNVKEVDAAADLAVRFVTSVAVNEVEEDDVVLRRVLKRNEYRTLHKILDKEDGPFASLWSTGEYRWDGKAQAKKFWNQT